MSAAERMRSLAARPPGSATLSGKLIPGIGTLTFCVAGVLTIMTAQACHSGAVAIIPYASWTPAFLYAAVLCLWWAAVFLLQQTLGHRLPAFWQLSRETIRLQLLAAIGLALLHLKTLSITVSFMVRQWPYLQRLEYHKQGYFNRQRFGIEVLLYALTWIAGAALYAQIARRKDALQTAELKQQLSSAHLRAMQMQMEPHFLFNTLNAITTL